MAKLPDETINAVLNLQKSLLAQIHEAKATEMTIFEQYGENEYTASVLEQLQNSQQRLIEPYSRFYTLLLRIAEAHPSPSSAMLNLLYQTIELAEATIPASAASTIEAKKDWNII